MILIDNIKFSYGKHEVFDNLSLQFGEGTIYGLLGLNGAGKSTLLYLMCGLLFPQGGKIEFNSAEQQMKCPFCESLFDVAALQAYDEALNEQTESSDMTWESEAGSAWEQGENENLRIYKCQYKEYKCKASF